MNISKWIMKNRGSIVLSATPKCKSSSLKHLLILCCFHKKLLWERISSILVSKSRFQWLLEEFLKNLWIFFLNTYLVVSTYILYHQFWGFHRRDTKLDISFGKTWISWKDVMCEQKLGIYLLKHEHIQKKRRANKNWAYLTILFKNESSGLKVFIESKWLQMKISYASCLEDPLTLFARFFQSFVGFFLDLLRILRVFKDFFWYFLEFSHSI